MSSLGMHRELVVAYDNRINDLLKHGELHALCYKFGALSFNSCFLSKTFKVDYLLLGNAAFTTYDKNLGGQVLCKIKNCSHIGNGGSEWSFVYLFDTGQDIGSSWEEYKELFNMFKDNCPNAKIVFLIHSKAWYQRFESSFTARMAREKMHREYNNYKYKTVELADEVCDSNEHQRSSNKKPLKILASIIATALLLYLSYNTVCYLVNNLSLDLVRETIKNVFSGITQ